MFFSAFGGGISMGEFQFYNLLNIFILYAWNSFHSIPYELSRLFFNFQNTKQMIAILMRFGRNYNYWAMPAVISKRSIA